MAFTRERLWRLRGPSEPLPQWIDDLICSYPLLFIMKVYHNGYFTPPPGRSYVNGMEILVDLVDCDDLCVLHMHQIMSVIGYDEHERAGMKMYFKTPEGDLETGLKELVVDEDVLDIRNYVNGETIIEVYLESDGAWTSPHSRPFIWV